MSPSPYPMTQGLTTNGWIFFVLGWGIMSHHPYEPMPGRPLIDTGDRVGGGVTPAVLPHHRTYGSRIRRFLPPVTRSSLRSADYSPIGL